MDQTMLKIYVDDVKNAVDELPPGTNCLCDQLVIVEGEVESDKEVSADLRTAKVYQAIGNSIFPLSN